MGVSCSVQVSRVGELQLVWFEGDVEKGFADLATDDCEFTVWFRARVLAAPSDDPPRSVLGSAASADDA
jgi:hypothetical protein